MEHSKVSPNPPPHFRTAFPGSRTRGDLFLENEEAAAGIVTKTIFRCQLGGLKGRDAGLRPAAF